MLNLLLLPWPTRINTADFCNVRNGKTPKRKDAPASYFRFQPKKAAGPRQFGRMLRRAIEGAREHAATLDAIVFPELALTFAQYQVAERIAVEERAILICGLRRASRAPRHDFNHCVFQAAGILREANGKSRRLKTLVKELRLIQAKHHRWCLDREQLVNCQLAGRLLAGVLGKYRVTRATPVFCNFKSDDLERANLRRSRQAGSGRRSHTGSWSKPGYRATARAAARCGSGTPDDSAPGLGAQALVKRCRVIVRQDADE